MIFWLTISALTIIAIAIMLIPYWLKSNANTIDNNELNIMLYERRVVELENDLSSDVIDKEQYDSAVSELKLQLLSDIPDDPEAQSKNQPNSHSQWSMHTIVATTILVPAISVSLYIFLGNKDLATGNIAAVTKQVAPEVEKMVTGLAKKLEENPNDLNGWVMLGRSYTAMNQHDKALAAFEKAFALDSENADVLTYLAETQAILNDNKLTGFPLKLITKALEINNKHARALWLAGHAHLQLGDKEKATKYWQTLLSTLPPEHESAQTVRKFIAQLGGNPGTAPVAQANKKRSKPQKNNDQGIRVKVKLAEKFKSKVPKDATVFVFARPTSGPKVPLAGVRLDLKDLPAEVVLGDGNAMIPGRTISSVAQVIIGARISKNGGPISKSGDLEGYSPAVSSIHPGILNITIDKVVN